MLKENPKSRPNIYQVLREACLMQGKEVPIKDVCQIHVIRNSKLTMVDLYWKDTVRIQAQPAITIPGFKRCITADRRGCFFTPATAAASHS